MISLLTYSLLQVIELTIKKIAQENVIDWKVHFVTKLLSIKNLIPITNDDENYTLAMKLLTEFNKLTTSSDCSVISCWVKQLVKYVLAVLQTVKPCAVRHIPTCWCGRVVDHITLRGGSMVSRVLLYQLYNIDHQQFAF